jgi:hypothetical protein
MLCRVSTNASTSSHVKYIDNSDMNQTPMPTVSVAV